MQVDIVLQYDRACEPQAFGNNHLSPAFLAYCLNGIVDGFGVQCLTVRFCTEITNIHLIVGKGRTLYNGHIKGKSFVEAFDICIVVLFCRGTLASAKHP